MCDTNLGGLLGDGQQDSFFLSLATQSDSAVLLLSALCFLYQTTLRVSYVSGQLCCVSAMLPVSYVAGHLCCRSAMLPVSYVAYQLCCRSAML